MDFIYRFEDYSSYLEASNAPSTMKNRGSRFGPENYRGFTKEFFGNTDSYEEAYNLAITGEPSKESKVLALAEKLENLFIPGEKDYRLMPQYDVSGEDCDIGRFLVGEPECMFTTVNEEYERVGGKIVKILTQASFLAQANSQQFENRGVAVLALTFLLEKAGYRVELVAGYTSRRNHHSIQTFVTLKKAEETLDLTRLCFTLMNPASLRRINFSFRETKPDVVKAFQMEELEYGSTDDSYLNKENADLTMRGQDHSYFSYENSSEIWIKKSIQQLGAVI